MKLIKLTLVLGTLLISFSVRAQQDKNIASYDALREEADRQISDYLKLVKMGYSEQEIFEDLGNVNFLTGNFRTASFWYQKLMDLIGEDAVSLSYQERYKVALHKAGIRQFPELEQDKDWFTRVREDYQIDRGPTGDQLTQSLAENYHRPDFGSDPDTPSREALERLQRYASPEISAEEGFQPGLEHAYTPPVALAANGRTAFFSKAEWVRPVTGLFSRKQLIHRLYRADYVEGQWKNIQEVPVAPKYASAMHPAISKDGRRLFFASDMPGSFGEYDIYVAELNWDGSIGVAKNLGEKVNTRKNDLYPQVLGDDLLFFASEGHEGFGGLDVFAAQVGTKRVGLAVNVGSPFNSRKDDFALHLMKDKGRAYVMSNRATTRDMVQQLVFAYQTPESSRLADAGNYRFLELRPLEANAGFTHTVFEE
ncbi:cell envelope biogenesis protein OmpA [Robiginitalea marina]|uniref:Cell envelope biogenesis protein OmpA n=1 Tax=Robiginitalea marina TaxID=2954105 RepID=A0ABT1AUW3_9FLAO|nr:cell envelope biogenesis protein OmpA [Robiginitalea marina]MCO5723405.1 cell envelope biogenesis protein OmpA [Robiginitalea marina]